MQFELVPFKRSFMINSYMMYIITIPQATKKVIERLCKVLSSSLS